MPAQLTHSASIEFRSHGDMLVPTPRMNTDEPRVDWWREGLHFDAVLIVVPTKSLKISNSTKRTKKWAGCVRCVLTAFRKYSDIKVIVIRKLLQSSAIVRNGVNAGMASLECARTAFGGKHTNSNAIGYFEVEQKSATIKLINKPHLWQTTLGLVTLRSLCSGPLAVRFPPLSLSGKRDCP